MTFTTEQECSTACGAANSGSSGSRPLTILHTVEEALRESGFCMLHEMADTGIIPIALGYDPHHTCICGFLNERTGTVALEGHTRYVRGSVPELEELHHALDSAGITVMPIDYDVMAMMARQTEYNRVSPKNTTVLTGDVTGCWRTYLHSDVPIPDEVFWPIRQAIEDRFVECWYSGPAMPRAPEFALHVPRLEFTGDDSDCVVLVHRRHVTAHDGPRPMGDCGYVRVRRVVHVRETAQERFRREYPLETTLHDATKGRVPAAFDVHVCCKECGTVRSHRDHACWMPTGSSADVMLEPCNSSVGHGRCRSEAFQVLGTTFEGRRIVDAQYDVQEGK